MKINQQIEASLQSINGRILTTQEYDYLYTRYSSEFKYYLKKFIDIEDAEDAVNDVFCKLYNDAVKFTQPTVLSYIWRCIMNKKIDILRKKAVSRMFSIERDTAQIRANYLTYNHTDDASDNIDNINKIMAIRKWIASTFNRKHQKVLILKYFQGLKIREISALLDVPAGSISTICLRFERGVKRRFSY